MQQWKGLIRLFTFLATPHKILRVTSILLIQFLESTVQINL